MPGIEGARRAPGRPYLVPATGTLDIDVEAEALSSPDELSPMPEQLHPSPKALRLAARSHPESTAHSMMRTKLEVRVEPETSGGVPHDAQLALSLPSPFDGPNETVKRPGRPDVQAWLVASDRMGFRPVPIAAGEGNAQSRPDPSPTASGQWYAPSVAALLLVRHEEAHPAGEGGDALRALTPTGRSRMHAQAATLFEHLPGLDRVYTSPLVRAVQTAEILVAAFDWHTPVIAHRTVLDPPSLARLADLLRTPPSPIGVVAMVGHEPTLSSFTAHLLGADFRGFRTGQALLLEATAGVYRVESSFRAGLREI